MKICMFDIEANRLINPDKIWCLSASLKTSNGWKSKVTTDYKDMRAFFEGADVIIGHNIVQWDIPNIERILEIKIKARVIDTLAFSWYLYPLKLIHGLDKWGSYFGIPKPKIIDWDDPNLIEEYKHRCNEDVKINIKLYEKIMKKLKWIYDSDEEVERFIDYLMFKMDCVASAEKSRWKLNTELVESSLIKLNAEKQIKVDELIEIMPMNKTYKEMSRPDPMYKKGKTYTKPKSLYKANNDLSAAGGRFKAHCERQGLNPETTSEVYVPSSELTAAAIKWLDILESLGLSDNHREPISYLWKEEIPKPTSSAQVKDYLYTLGWIPEAFNEGVNGEIPQIRVEKKGVKVLCKSVTKLFKKEPRLVALEGLTILTHRIGILNGFMKNVDEEGFIKAQMSGFTNTLRLKHKTIVNLPSVKKPYGDIIRGVLTCRDGYELCGSDMSALESRTRDHYIYPHDPEYVETMLDEDYDAHLAIAVQAKFITEDESNFYKWYKKNH